MSNLYITNITALMDETLFQNAFVSVNEERQQKILTYQKTKDRARSLAAGLLLKYAMKQAGKEDLLLTTNCHGKILAETQEHFYLSLSHSGDYAICAVSEQNIGADLQERKSLKIDLAKRFFHPREAEYLQTVLEKDGKVAYEEKFFSLWCLKESYLKYTGLGFSGGMQKENFLPLLEGTKAGNVQSVITINDVIYGACYPMIENYAMAVVCSEKEHLPQPNWVKITEIYINERS